MLIPVANLLPLSACHDSNGKCSAGQEILPQVSTTLFINSLCCHWTYSICSTTECVARTFLATAACAVPGRVRVAQGVTKRCRLSLLINSAPHIRVQIRGEGEVAGSQLMSTAEAVDMNGRFQMQGGKNWILPK
jgi:hypothetical protein